MPLGSDATYRAKPTICPVLKATSSRYRSNPRALPVSWWRKTTWRDHRPRHRWINGTSLTSLAGLSEIISEMACRRLPNFVSSNARTHARARGSYYDGDARCYIRQINGEIDGYRNDDRTGLNYSATRLKTIHTQLWKNIGANYRRPSL